jgi:purine-nucleoside phosphorylase
MHAGNLVFGSWKGKNIVIMQGRLHFYEGHSMQEVTFPVIFLLFKQKIKVLKFLGVEKLIITNSSGAVNTILKAGDIMIIKDHINLLGSNPLIGDNDDRFGTRFPDMSEVYDKNLRDILK